MRRTILVPVLLVVAISAVAALASSSADIETGELAKKLGVTPTPPKDDAAMKAHVAAMKQLSGLSGSAFDHAFLQHEVAFHKGGIDAVTTTLLPAIKNAEAKDLVTTVAPTFQAHMMAAENLEKKLDAK